MPPLVIRGMNLQKHPPGGFNRFPLDKLTTSPGGFFCACGLGLRVLPYNTVKVTLSVLADLGVFRRVKGQGGDRAWGLLPRQVLQHSLGVIGGWKALGDASTYGVIIRYLLGDFNKGNNRMNSLRR